MTINISKDRRLTSGEFDREKEYWLEQLTSDWVKGYFPYDHTSFETNDLQRDQEYHSITGQLFEQLLQ